MNRRRLLLCIAALLFCVTSTSIFAIEVQEAKVTHTKSYTWHEYEITADGKPENRLTFSARQDNPPDFLWDLYVLPTDTSDWAPAISFKEYTEIIYRCVDRFVASFPDGQVRTIQICITLDSQTWQDIRKKLIPILQDRTGFAVEVPKVADAVAESTFRSSPEIRQIGLDLAKRLNQKFTPGMFVTDGLVLERRTHEDYTRTWQDIVKLPTLSMKMYSLSGTLNFEWVDRSRKK